ncbi:hypothetical protein DWV13_12200 [Clostridium botulinum]|uniref:polysaccharide pyruvyl transferase family protein n=1 Tax=Clostridium TaxID=1485 RepID=UPI0013F6B30C|nr:MULTISPECIES: polysaccharide pyruvyl transferase family protein [Clostridium]MCS6132375.1 hypothetical protein [Clostridium botulinum]NFL45735.1 hypothetical protein [Clostridium botulinum]
MKIYIKHIWNTFNYGSCMMAISLLDKINKNIDNVKFYVDADSEEDIQRLKNETGIQNIKRSIIESSDNFIIKCRNKIKRIILNRLVKKIDNIIVIGGDDISEYYGIKKLESELYKLKLESKQKNIILIGQTMGPFSDDRGNLAKECLSKTKIYTRDDKNLEYLKKLNFNNVNKGRDLAFIDLPMQHKANIVLDKYNIRNEKYISIVASGLINCYTNNEKNYLKSQVEIIREIFRNNRLHDFKIVLLIHVTRSYNNDDKLIINKIINELTNEEKKKIIVIDDEILPSQAREILGNGLFTITGRMHAAVSTFYMRKPAISLSYSVKYAGVIGDGLDMNELVIESADEKLWNTDEISKLVNQKVNYVLDNYDKLVKKIDVKVLETSRIVEEELEDAIKQIKNNINNQ